MNDVVVHGSLNLSYPDGFGVMDEEELRLLYQDDNTDRWGIWDKERHLIFVVYWHDSSALLGKMVGTKSLAKRAERLLSKGLKANAYHCDGFYSTQVAGTEAEGFVYTYQVQDVNQVARVTVLRHGACCYTLYWYAREEGDPTDAQVLDDLLASISFV